MNSIGFMISQFWDNVVYLGRKQNGSKSIVEKVNSSPGIKADGNQPKVFLDR